MILRNYHNMLVNVCMGVPYYTQADGYLWKVKTTSGAISGLSIYSGALELLSIGNASNEKNGVTSADTAGVPRLVFGTEDNAVTYDDFALGNECTTISKSAFDVSFPVYNEATRKFTKTVTCNLTNTATSAVTLKEMGVIATPVLIISGNAKNYPVLICREILDTPITIPAGDAVKYTHTFEFTMPTIG